MSDHKTEFTEYEREYIRELGLDHVLDNDPEALIAYIEDIAMGRLDTLEDFEESYCGTYSGWNEDQAIGEYAEELYEDIGGTSELPDWIRPHIDWEGVARDMRYSGEYCAIPVPGKGGIYKNFAVFRNI